MNKLQFLNTTYNLMIKFFIGKISWRQFSNFLAWYGVELTLRGYPLKIKLVGNAINFITGRFLKAFLISKLQNNQSTKLIKSYIVSFYQRLLLVNVSLSYLYHMWEFTFSLSEPCICQKNIYVRSIKI